MSSSQSGGSAVLLPQWAIEAIAQVAALIDRYGSLPRAIFALISLYILNGLFSVVGVITAAVLGVFDILVGALGVVQSFLVGAFGVVGVDILGAVRGVQGAVADVAAVAGPLAPVVAVLAASVVLYVSYRVSVALLGELPVGSSVVDLLGLR